MKRLFLIALTLLTAINFYPTTSLAAGGIYPSGGGSKTVGQTFTVTVSASGATFDTVHGAISISGPVSVVSFTAGSATWIAAPTNGGTFDGAYLGQKQTSATIATIKLKATAVGSGAVTTSGVSLKNAGSVVGTGSSSASYTIAKAADLPGVPTVSSSSHPDQNTAYEATTIALSWNKDSGVDAFSYLLDQTATTTPAAKTTSAETTATYADQAIGTYYFHIRAHKADGWGSTAHFKINIKEPDAKIDETLDKPSKIEIKKAEDFANNITDGTVSGIIISGTTVAEYTAILTIAPALTPPEGKTLTAVTDDDGNFEIPIDWSIPAGHYTITIQGQKEKVLTPVSDPIIFEITQAKGGEINILTDEDTNPPETIAGAISNNNLNWRLIIPIVAGILLITLIVVLIVIKRKRGKLKL